MSGRRAFPQTSERRPARVEANKPLLNQINYVLLHLHLAGKHDLKPTHEELKEWLHSGQVDVLRISK